MYGLSLSPSSRRAWIEIPNTNSGTTPKKVALLAEGVDRNRLTVFFVVAEHHVALLAEGVDRNDAGSDHRVASVQSPSSRRAWIEIRAAEASATVSYVALLAEGVDRNAQKWRNRNTPR